MSSDSECSGLEVDLSYKDEVNSWFPEFTTTSDTKKKKKKRSHSLSTEETLPMKKPKQNELINKPDKDIGKKKKKKQKSDLDVTDSTLLKTNIKLNQDEQESGPKEKKNKKHKAANVSILFDPGSKTSDLDVRLSEEDKESQKTKKKKKKKLKSTEQAENVKKHISTEQSSVEQSTTDSPEWKQVSKSKKQRRKEEVKLLKREHEQLDDDSDDVSDDVVKKSKVVCTEGLIQEKINKTLKKTERLQKMNQGKLDISAESENVSSEESESKVTDIKKKPASGGGGAVGGFEEPDVRIRRIRDILEDSSITKNKRKKLKKKLKAILEKRSDDLSSELKKLIKRLLKPVVLNKPTPHLIPVEEKNKAVPQAIPDGEVKDGTEKTEVKSEGSPVAKKKKKKKRSKQKNLKKDNRPEHLKPNKKSI